MATKYNPGEYVARVTTWGLGKSKNKKTPQFVLRFEPIGKVNPNDPTGNLIPCPNYEQSIYRVITKNTVDYLVEDLKYLGYDKASFKYLDPESEGAHDFQGIEINVRCEHEEYNGSINDRWSLSRGGSAEIEPLEQSKVRELDSLFGKTLKDKIAVSEQDPTAQTVKTPNAEEIPF